MKKVLVLGVLGLLLVSCADSKEFTIDGKQVTVEPYGLLNQEERNDSINYRINKGNVILSALFSPTVIVPVVLVGWEFHEPVSKK